jgi:hypothetical protein
MECFGDENVNINRLKSYVKFVQFHEFSPDLTMNPKMM